MNSGLAGAVLHWGDEHRRDLPWRRTRDPWAVLVSELMLQQTQVARVVPRYHAFLQSFPATAACAAASPGDVVRAWAGLGYNRRALNLHAAATMIERQPGGAFPASVEGLRQLPGVGPYTARAVLAYAFEADAAVVDTNVGRAMARFHGRRLRPAEAQRLADEALPAGEAWRWNQAVMDLGAMVCTARTPSCDACPLASDCAWHAADGEEPDPAMRSAFVSGAQSRFEGSDRQGRGRLVAALRAGAVPVTRAAAVAGWPDDADRAERVWRGLVADGLARLDGDGALVLP